MLKFPKVHEIRVDVNGRSFDGAYSIMLGQLVVYYQGHTSSVAKPTADIESVAMEMLRKLVAEKFVEKDRIPKTLPEPMRDAAAEYVNNWNDDRLLRRLIESFGPVEYESTNHRKISWLCLEALKRLVPFWPALSDDNAVAEVLDELQAWFLNPTRSMDWQRLQEPIIAYRNGHRVHDCYACASEPLGRSLASCAKFLQTANIADAVLSLRDAWSAHNEGCWPEDEPRPFEQWLVEVALPKAYEFEG